ncbi:MAG: type II toxin-antitoxin system PemK/MazF family toxin, partial [Candidatus Methylomirabilia bacterium]
SNEAFNRTSGLLTVLPVTPVKPERSPHPFEVFLPAGAAGNPVDSIVLPHQIRTISGGRLQRVYGRLSDPSLRREVAQKVLQHLEFLDLREVEEEP